LRHFAIPQLDNPLSWRAVQTLKRYVKCFVLDFKNWEDLDFVFLFFVGDVISGEGLGSFDADYSALCPNRKRQSLTQVFVGN